LIISNLKFEKNRLRKISSLSNSNHPRAKLQIFIYLKEIESYLKQEHVDSANFSKFLPAEILREEYQIFFNY
jgi:hypothetical protein